MCRFQADGLQVNSAKESKIKGLNTLIIGLSSIGNLMINQSQISIADFLYKLLRI